MFKIVFNEGSLNFLKDKKWFIIISLMISIFCVSGFVFRKEIYVLFMGKNQKHTTKKANKAIRIDTIVKKDTVFIVQKDTTKKKRYSSTHTIREKLKLKATLQDIVNKYHIDYINVNRFKDSLKMMDCVVEQNAPEHLPRIHRLQDWYTEPFIEKIAHVDENGFFYIPDLSKDPDPYFNKTIPRFNVKSVFYVKIENKNVLESNGKYEFWGFVSYAWSEPTNFSEFELSALLKESKRFEEAVLKLK